MDAPSQVCLPAALVRRARETASRSEVAPDELAQLGRALLAACAARPQEQEAEAAARQAWAAGGRACVVALSRLMLAHSELLLSRLPGLAATLGHPQGNGRRVGHRGARRKSPESDGTSGFLRRAICAEKASLEYF